MTKFRLLVLGIALLAAFPAAAKEKPLGTFGGWSAFADNQGGQTVCYMVTTKLVKSAGPAKRSGPYLMITHRPIEGSVDVFSYGAGTLLDTKRDVKISMGKSAFDLFAVRDIAWARDAQTDHRLAASVTSNAQALAKAIPAARRGVKKSAAPIADLFDLAGAPAAYRAIGKACGLSPAKPAAKKTIAKPR